MPDEIKVGPLARDFSGIDLRIDKRDAGATALSFSASSETPVERFFGTEVLSHDRGAIRMERFSRGAAPLLFNHDWDDPVGMITDARVKDGRLMVDAQMFATARAREVEQMIDGGLRNVSIGYQIHTVEEDVKRGVFRATDWEPLEVSIVTVPADSSVGIGRSMESVPVRVTRATDQPAAPAASHGGQQMADSNNAAAGATADVRVVDDFDPAKHEAGRTETIRKLAMTNDINDERQVMHWIRSGKSWNAIADDILKIKEERSKASPAVLGLTPQETKRFSIVRAINAVVNHDWTKAGFEAEVSRATAQRIGKQLNDHSFIMPLDIMSRELIVGSSTDGGYLVGTQHQASSFIELLRNRSVAMRLGARTLSGLQGNVTIPTQATAGAAAWLLESGTATANTPTFGQKTLSPKHVAGYMELSRQLLMQSSPDAEMLVNADLAAILALKVDAAVLAGTSTDSSVPLGIRYQSGLGTANPTAGTAVTYADLIKFQSTVAASNALFDQFSYVCHPLLAGLLMSKAKFTNGGVPIWEGALLDGNMVGKPAMSSVQITSGTMLGGDFSQVVIGEWGTVEIESNPYANFQAGIVGVRAFYSCDVLVRYAAAFAIGTGMSG